MFFVNTANCQPLQAFVFILFSSLSSCVGLVSTNCIRHKKANAVAMQTGVRLFARAKK